MMKFIRYNSLIFLLFFLFFHNFQLLGKFNETSPNQYYLYEPIISITAVGDIMMGSYYPHPLLPPNDGKKLFNSTKEILRKADLTFGNLEGPLCNIGKPLKKYIEGTSYAFRTPTKFVYNLLDAGFDVVSLANNHIEDFGYIGATSTKKVLKMKGIKYSSKDGEIAEFEIKGITIGLIAFSYGSPPRSIVYPKLPLLEIESLAKKYDILIVSIHAGKEGEKAVHVKDEDEIFLNEPRGNIVKFSREAIDRGASLILGHGPHVPRALEIYKRKLIAYSLGNFCTYGNFNIKGRNGYAPILFVELDRNGNFISGKIHSFIQIPPGIPVKDEKERAFNLIKKLSLMDFPESSLIFYPNGIIVPYN